MTSASAAPKIRVRIVSIAQEGRSHKALTLAACGDGVLPPFEAGAHIDVHISGNIIRQYSLAGVSAPGEPYLICVKRAADSRGGSVRLYDCAKVGDELIISAPRNLFRLEDAGYHVLVAAGVGITPIIGMALALEALNQRFVLHYYTRSRADTPFLERVSAGFSGGAVELHHSESGDSLRTATPAGLLALPANARVYACGPQGFIDRLQSTIGAGQFPVARFHSECFSPPSIRGSSEDGSFDVEIHSSRRIFHIPAGLSIAQVLNDAGIPITLSCEQGMCGACLTPVLEGIPEHRDSVQSAREQSQNNFIAICCSRSKSGKLTLDI